MQNSWQSFFVGPDSSTGPPLKQVFNTDGEVITKDLWDAAESSGIDPVLLLAAVIAESNINQRAERWGTRTKEAKRYLESGNRASLQALIYDVWPDISFSYSQRIILFHDNGDRTPNIDNVLAVREYVFNHPREDLFMMAQRLAGNFNHPSCDGTWISVLTIFNAGRDRRNEPSWMVEWAGNIKNYNSCIAEADRYRK